MVKVLGSVSATDSYCTPAKRGKLMEFKKRYKEDEFLQFFLKINFMNGVDFFHISYCTNHNGLSVDKIVDFFKNDLPEMLGTEAFGILHIYDDEGQRKVDEFEVYILRMGKVTLEKDYYFSPFSKKISPDGISQF